MATWTDADVATLKAAVASGILSIRYGGPPERFEQYQNIAEMKKTLADMLADNARDSGKRRFHFATVWKGT